jgi:hypothetical protein
MAGLLPAGNDHCSCATASAGSSSAGLVQLFGEASRVGAQLLDFAADARARHPLVQ